MGRFSVVPTTATLDRTLSDRAFRVLGVLASYADKDGWCWPSLASVGAEMGISRQAVQQQVVKLRDLGYLEIRSQHRENRGQTTNKYRVICDHPPQGNRLAPPASPGLAPNNNTPLERSFSKEKGSGEPAQNLKKIVFSECLSVLVSKGTKEKEARSILGKWCKAYGEESTVSAVLAAANSFEPVAYVEGIFAKTKPPKRNRPKITDLSNEPLWPGGLH